MLGDKGKHPRRIIMKKRLIVVLAVLATVVGMAFAKAKRVYKYSCGHYSDGSVTSTIPADQVGDVANTTKPYFSNSSMPGKCPHCLACDTANTIGDASSKDAALNAFQCTPSGWN